MNYQIFNVWGRHSRAFYFTIEVRSRTEPSETARRLRKVLARRLMKDTRVEPVVRH